MGKVGTPAFSIQDAASRGVVPPVNTSQYGAQSPTTNEGATGSTSPTAGHPASAKGAAITIAAMAGLLVIGNMAQERESLPVGEGLLKIRPFNVVAIGVSATLFLVGAKYIAKRFPVPGMSDVILAA